MLYDVIIVGGGPAGLNAAVVLGRCMRKVLLFDTGKQRNRHSHGMHNYLTRDHVLPADFLKKAHQEIQKYAVEFRGRTIVSAEKTPLKQFKLKDDHGDVYYCKKLLLATGLVDKVPKLENIDAFYGKSIFHCPYCDGWEVRDKIIGIYAKNKNGVGMCVSMKTWSNDIILFTDGKKYLKQSDKEILGRYDIPWFTAPIKTLVGDEGTLEKVQLQNGDTIPCDAIFFTDGFDQQCSLVTDLNCKMTSKGVAVTNRYEQTNIDGLYVAGDASKDMHFVVVAAAEGAKAAVSINQDLQKEERPIKREEPKPVAEEIEKI